MPEAGVDAGIVREGREQNPLVSVPGIAGYAEHALRVVRSARVHLAVLSHDLDRRIFGTEAFIAATRKFVLQNPHTRLRVLIHSPGRAVRGSNPLIELAGTLASFIELRELPEDRKTVVEEYLIADSGLMLHRSAPDDLSAHFYPASPEGARAKLKDFDTLWERSEAVAELRRLRI